MARQLSRCPSTQVPCVDPSIFKIARSRHTRGCGRTTFQSKFVLACFLSAIHMLRIGGALLGRQGADRPLVRGPPDRQDEAVERGSLLPSGPNYCTCGRTYPRDHAERTARPRVSIGQISFWRRRTGTARAGDLGSVMWSGCTSRAFHSSFVLQSSEAALTNTCRQRP
jgi:hypothetical protein